jgi:hypothetical protein
MCIMREKRRIVTLNLLFKVQFENPSLFDAPLALSYKAHPSYPPSTADDRGCNMFFEELNLLSITKARSLLTLLCSLGGGLQQLSPI